MEDVKGDPALIWKIVLISRENNRDCHQTMEVQIKGDQWNKRFRTVQVYWMSRAQREIFEVYAREKKFERRWRCKFWRHAPSEKF